ncbi:MAG: hypothetical protein WB630_10980 [Candidatus Acidiferrales bacterium]
MPESCQPDTASQKFEWEQRFYQCLSLPHIDLAERAAQAESIIYQRLSRPDAGAISAAEQEAIDEARQHLRKIQVGQLGYPVVAAELAKKNQSLPEPGAVDRLPRDLTGRPIPLSERRRLWKAHSA